MSKYLVVEPFSFEPRKVIPSMLPDGSPNVIELDDETAKSYGAVVTPYYGPPKEAASTPVTEDETTAKVKAASEAEAAALAKQIADQNAAVADADRKSAEADKKSK